LELSTRNNEDKPMAFDFPLSTSQVAELLDVPEHSVRNQIKLNRIRPTRLMGRRAWTPADVLRCANILGRDSIEVRNIVAVAQKSEAAK
jgi:hypothetical protein